MALKLKREPDVDLTETYNALAGKLVSNDELTRRLKEAGYKENDPLSPREQKNARRHRYAYLGAAARMDASLHITTDALAEIEKDLRRQWEEGMAGTPGSLKTSGTSREDFFSAAFASASLKRGGDLYMDAVSSLQVVAAYSDNKQTRIYAEALKACADHKSEVGTKLQVMDPILRQLGRKVASQLGLMA